MSLFSFPPVEPSRGVPIGQVDIPFWQWNAFRFGEAKEQTFGAALGRFYDDITDSSPVLSPDEANKRFGVEDLSGLPGSGLKFIGPIRHDTAYNRRLRKLKELEDINIRELAAHGSFSPKAVGSFFLGAIPGSMAHPLDFAVNLIPFVGQESKASTVAKLGGGAFRQRMASGLLLSDEQLGMRYGPLAGAALNASIGNAIVEIPVAIQNFRDQRIYGIGDAVANVVIGGIAGGSLHLLGRGLSKAATMFDAATPEVKTRAVKTAIAQVLNGQDIDVSKVVSVDREAIKAAIKFDEAGTKAEIESAQKRLDEIEFEIQKTGPTPELVTAKQDIFQQFPALETKAVEQKTDALFSLDEFAERGNTKPVEQVVEEALASGSPIHSDLLEVTGNTQRAIDQGYELVGDRYVDHADINNHVERIRQENVAAALESQRKQFNADAIAKERIAKEIKTQQELGRILSDEDVNTYASKEVPEAADIEILNNDAKNIEEQLTMALDEEGNPKGFTEQEKAFLKDVQEAEPEIIKAAIECVIRNA